MDTLPLRERLEKQPSLLEASRVGGRQSNFSGQADTQDESSLVYNLLHPGDSKPDLPSSLAKVFTWQYYNDYL